jgi:hypothetical protein
LHNQPVIPSFAPHCELAETSNLGCRLSRHEHNFQGVRGISQGGKVGQRVGLGWFSESCLVCSQCLAGHHNLCPTVEPTIVKRHGC